MFHSHVNNCSTAVLTLWHCQHHSNKSVLIHKVNKHCEFRCVSIKKSLQNKIHDEHQDKDHDYNSANVSTTSTNMHQRQRQQCCPYLQGWPHCISYVYWYNVYIGQDRNRASTIAFTHDIAVTSQILVHKIPHGGFQTWGYPQISHFNGIFPYKPSSYWGSSMTMEIPTFVYMCFLIPI